MQPEKILGPEWTRQAHGRVPFVYMSPDGSHIAAASEDHDVYLMEYGGRLLWASTTGDDVVFAKCSDDGEFVGSYSKDNVVSFFSRRGDQLWTARISRKIRCMDVSPDGSFVVVGADDCVLRAFDRSGNIAWSKAYHKPVTSVCISGSGALVVAGTADSRAYMFGKDGNLRWEYIMGSPVVHVYTSFDGEFSYVLETRNNTLHLLSDRGGELAENSYSQRITDISITEDGRYVAIGFANSFVYYTDKNFQQLWRQTVPGPVERIKVSGDGTLIFVSTASRSVYVLNRNGQALLMYPFDGVVTGLDATVTGEHFVASAGDTVFMFSIGRYLQYISREQVKTLKMIAEDEAKAKGKGEGRNAGRPETGLTNSCHRCGEPILSGRVYCNYCDMMVRRGK
ncbi:MAG: Outer membrane protein assembly factor BamB [Methanocella sp. PtaU1.Bin125]|nr:MAG: Outer membrane protein assembly factor BamB [Methanocella sp. PtaU1.Bin125]